jgi:hypothetical protein
MTAKYGAKRWYPPALAYEALIQRAQLEVADSETFSVTMDDMSGKTPNDSEYKENLTKHHEQLKQTGCNFFPMQFPSLVGRLKFVNSRDSNIVQAADLVAYNVFRQFREHGEKWEDQTLDTLPTYRWFAHIASKFCCDPNGRIQGYGIVKLPLYERVLWTVVKAAP